MAESYHVHTVRSNEAKEIFITAVPALGTPVQENAEALFTKIRDTLEASNAFIFQERIFATEAAFESLSEIHDRILAPIDDGVKPSCLVCGSGKYTDFAGIQVHAVAGIAQSGLDVIHPQNSKGRYQRLDEAIYRF